MIVVFDLDGTLIDTSARIHAVYADVVAELGGVALDRDDYWRLKRRNTPHESILERSGLRPRHKQEFLDHFISLVELPESLRLDIVLPGAAEAVDEIAAQGHQRFLVTLRRSADAVLSELSALGLDRHFEPGHVVTGHTDGAGYLKKAELIRELILARAGTADRVAVIGDTEADITAAQLLTRDLREVIAVGVTSGIRDGEFLSALGPDFLLESVVELPGLIHEGLAAPASGGHLG